MPLPDVELFKEKINELDRRKYQRRVYALQAIADEALKLRENATDVNDAMEEVGGFLHILQDLSVEVSVETCYFIMLSKYWLGIRRPSGSTGVVVRALDLVIRGSWVRIPLGAYALRQGILSTLASLDPGVVNGYPAGIYSLYGLWAPIGSSAKAGVIICQWWCNAQLSILI